MSEPTVVLNNKPGKFDNEHRDKLVQAILRAIVSESTCPVEIGGKKGNALHLRSAEIADAFGVVLAMIASSHKDALSRRDRRLLAEETTKRLFRRIGEMQAVKMPFPVVTTYDDDPVH
jgi:hypothetical protein